MARALGCSLRPNGGTRPRVQGLDRRVPKAPV